MKIRSYSELRRIDTFEERFDYLVLNGSVGSSTFGFDRYVNQLFYTSKQWRDVRREVALRDNGCDLGIDGYEIHYRPLIHHMNPITVEDISEGSEYLLDPEYLITTTHDTHNAIHYGNRSLLRTPFVERSRGDTKLW